MKTILEIKKSIMRKIFEEMEVSLINKNTSHAIGLGNLLDKVRYTQKGDEDYDYGKGANK